MLSGRSKKEYAKEAQAVAEAPDAAPAALGPAYAIQLVAVHVPIRKLLCRRGKPHELAFLPASIQPVRWCGSAVAQCRSSYPLCLSVNHAPVAQRIRAADFGLSRPMRCGTERGRGSGERRVICSVFRSFGWTGTSSVARANGRPSNSQVCRADSLKCLVGLAFRGDASRL